MQRTAGLRKRDWRVAEWFAHSGPSPQHASADVLLRAPSIADVLEMKRGSHHDSADRGAIPVAVATLFLDGRGSPELVVVGPPLGSTPQAPGDVVPNGDEVFESTLVWPAPNRMLVTRPAAVAGGAHHNGTTTYARRLNARAGFVSPDSSRFVVCFFDVAPSGLMPAVDVARSMGRLLPHNSLARDVFTGGLPSWPASQRPLPQVPSRVEWDGGPSSRDAVNRQCFPYRARLGTRTESYKRELAIPSPADGPTSHLVTLVAPAGVCANLASLLPAVQWALPPRPPVEAVVRATAALKARWNDLSDHARLYVGLALLRGESDVPLQGFDRGASVWHRMLAGDGGRRSVTAAEVDDALQDGLAPDAFVLAASCGHLANRTAGARAVDLMESFTTWGGRMSGAGGALFSLAYAYLRGEDGHCGADPAALEVAAVHLRHGLASASAHHAATASPGYEGHHIARSIGGLFASGGAHHLDPAWLAALLRAQRGDGLFGATDRPLKQRLTGTAYALWAMAEWRRWNGGS